MRVTVDDHTERYMVKTHGIKTVEEQALNKRELECLKLTALGYSSREVAEQLSISLKTAETYRTHTIQKLGARNACHAVTLAIFQGVLQFQPGEVYVT